MDGGRLRSGHQPLDEVLGCGLPGNGISIIMGLPGAGKTIIAQQYTFHNAERGQARRILIDSLMDLEMAAIDDTRFREFMYSLLQRFSRHGISVLTTCETPDLHDGAALPEFAISHLADNLIRLGYHGEHGAMSRSLAVIKTRASSHDPAMRQFSISPGGISLTDTAAPPQRPVTGEPPEPAGPGRD